jgi:hypothetical protein
MAVDYDEASTSLDREFSHSENEQALRDELAALIAKE